MSTTYHHYGNGMGAGTPILLSPSGHHITQMEPVYYHEPGDPINQESGIVHHHHSNINNMNSSSSTSSMMELNHANNNSSYNASAATSTPSSGIVCSTTNEVEFSSCSSTTTGNNNGSIVPNASIAVTGNSSSNGGNKGWNGPGNDNNNGECDAGGGSGNTGENPLFPGGLEVLWKEVPEECQKMLTPQDVPDAAKFRGYFTVCELIALKRSLTAKLKRSAKPGEFIRFF